MNGHLVSDMQPPRGYRVLTPGRGRTADGRIGPAAGKSLRIVQAVPADRRQMCGRCPRAVLAHRGRRKYGPHRMTERHHHTAAAIIASVALVLIAGSLALRQEPPEHPMLSYGVLALSVI